MSELDTLNRVENFINNEESKLCNYINDTLIKMCEQNYYDVAKFLLDKHYNKIYSETIEYIIRYACETTNTSILKLMIDYKHYQLVLLSICKYNNAALLKCFVNSDCPLRIRNVDDPLLYNIVKAISNNNNMNMMDIFFYNINNSDNREKFVEILFICLLREKQLKLLDLIIDRYNEIIDVRQIIYEIICKLNNYQRGQPNIVLDVDIIEYIIQKYSNSRNIKLVLFKYACNRHKLNILQILVDKYPKFINTHQVSENIGNLYREALASHDSNILEFLVKNFSKFVDFNENNILKVVCYNGNLKCVRELIDSSNNLEINDKIFINACHNHNSDVIEFLIDTYPDVVYDHTEAITIASLSNNLEIVEFLANKYYDINIHSGDDWVFLSVCERGYFDMAKLLKRLYPKINHHARDDYCYKKTTNQRILLWLQCECKTIMTKSARK